MTAAAASSAGDVAFMAGTWWAVVAYLAGLAVRSTRRARR